MTDRFEDNRGFIQDLLGPNDGVTLIFTRAGAVRGNHIHESTEQFVYVAKGRLYVVVDTLVAGLDAAEYGEGSFIDEPVGLPHAWQALEDSTVLVFKRGPGAAADYEKDTRRLPPDRWLLSPHE